MTYNHVEMKQFLGLYLQRNSFSTPEGALEQASNCVIARDGVIEKRRGFYTTLGGGASTLNNLSTYQSTVLALYSDKIQYLNAAGTAGTTMSGETVTVLGGRIGRFFEANNNCYFTTDNGVMKLESAAGPVYKAGVPPGLDLVGNFAKANGPIGAGVDSTTDLPTELGAQVNYRIVFIRRDSNNNLVFGTPSDYLTLINRPVTEATWARSGAGPYTITVTSPSTLDIATGMVVTVSSMATSPSVPLVGDGAHTVTVTGSTTFTWSQVIDPGAASGTLNFTSSKNVNLEFSIPSEANSTSYGYQIYRSSQSSSAGITAPSDFALIQEAMLTAGNITAGVVYFTDTILDIFRGAQLYTNPNSREGELQASARPPLCQDVAVFKNCAFYANATYRQAMPINLVTTDAAYLVDGSIVTFAGRSYTARTGVGNSTVNATSVTGVGTLTITYAAHGFAVGGTVNITNLNTGATFPAGVYTIATVPTANTFTITGTGTATSLSFQGITDGGGARTFQLVPPTVSVAAGIDATARGLVKAINRDSLSTIYARYVSTAEDIPGQIALESKVFAAAFALTASSTAVGQAFYPVLPTSGTTVSSTAETLANVLAVSKVGEPEAVPNQNRLPIGARNKRILRAFALRDSLIVVKEDGVYRVDGDTPDNFTASILDSTIICLAANSAVTLNNEVFLLANQGFCAVSNSAVRIISRKIEDPVTPIYSYSQMPAATAGIAYESSRLYLVSTLLPNTTVASVVWCYNTLTDEWSTWDKTFIAGVVGPGDQLYAISTSNSIIRERKQQNRTDYADESYPTTVISVGSDLKSAVISVPSYTPRAGDIIVTNGNLSRVTTATASGLNFIVTFDYQTTLVPGATTTYAGYVSTVKLAPYHAGQTNRSKQFAQMQVHTRDESLSSLDVSFQGDTFGGSEVTNWKASRIGGFGGWGQFPWGFVPWGQGQGINLNYETKASAILRIYIPLFAQRTSFIQPVLIHSNAGEPMNIQSLGFQVRGYGERVSR